ncbi:Fructosyl amino acid [Colletotrichum higginsianum IMI 349063]|uniref:Fructosyl amino acid n=1 Tax=Colletotrichum higginsianum (strain IMI 349063) TaxID=759273 RepID=A0A1B7YW59_COLHI|nr:Fructosyl amino acid [Colletotrichum higginsianum IMI 349063]OBR16277.1 Fructosyl amino acid [Colletotrichum higginsianum IMI 349063]
MNETAKPSVFIIDGNVVGTSTAYHLAQWVVTVLKGLQSTLEWRSPPPPPPPASLFASMYRESGWLMAGHSLARSQLDSTFETVTGASRKAVWVPNGWGDEKQGLD